MIIVQAILNRLTNLVFFQAEMQKKKSEIQRKKHAMLTEFLSKQRSLIVKLENKGTTAEERKSILQVCNNCYLTRG